MLGGSMFPYDNLPKFLQLLGQYTPNRWAVLTMLGVVHSKPMTEFIAPIAALLALGILGSLLAMVFFRRQLGAGQMK